jgi:hypothetical protein
MVAGPERQRPSPSQTLTSPTAAPSQVPALQTVPAGCRRHWPWPSQVPSRPQLEAGDAGQAADCSGIPLGTKLQTPGALGSLQVLQVSAQALSQQTPSTQKPLWQSFLQPQAWPFARRAPPSAAQAASPPASRRATPVLSLPHPPPHPVAASRIAPTASRKSDLTRRPYRPCQ